MIFTCTKELDFNQLDELSLKPTVALNLIFFNALATEFFDDGSSSTAVKDAFVIDLFRRDFIVDNVVKAEFVFETANSINGVFSVQIDFLDSSKQLKHTFTFTALASPTNTDVVTTHTEVFENISLDNLKATNEIELTIQALAGGSSLDNYAPGSIQLKSNVIFYLKIEESE